jgi:hypothetical protein
VLAAVSEQEVAGGAAEAGERVGVAVLEEGLNEGDELLGL